MNEILAVALITILAVISPGPDFAMVTRNSFLHGRKAGLTAALGIACGVQIHVFYTVFGIALLIVQSPRLLFAMKLLGAAYLIYIGIKSFTNKNRVDLNAGFGTSERLLSIFRMGFLTNALNPKTMLFVVSTYTQVVKPDSSLVTNFAYGLFMSFSHWAWFSLVAIFFSAEMLRQKMLSKQIVLDRVIGAALMILGAMLLMPTTLR
ncbi:MULTISPECIES: LysE family translocator [Pseudomonas]|uniref:LysE family translocator n=1 Tax=Pseudomonas TaxID=286 RepID=UPI0003754283|nr:MULTISPECIES: LysE family translocator [Pseudomonas]MCD4865017.1 LysE family translocator [Pseudomonas sp. PLB05]MDC7830475.1 LysE family translocator [Pseudomonas benzopyrenica]NRH42879.1 LysE family translocator [Pseudomonas sp. MS15a(2019)]